MRRINETVILAVGDDELNHPEILCKCLKANALQNMANYTGQGGGSLKREKTGQVEAEWYNYSGGNFWKDWIYSLKDICPLYGYTIPTKGLGSIGFITVETPTLTIDNSCCSTTYK